MTGILSWNIQYGRGVDGRIDFDRIAAVVRAMGEADVLCLQEIADGFAELDGGAGADQAAEVARRFPDFHPVFRPALEWFDGSAKARRFGNIILSRLPVLEVEAHHLPRPADGGVTHMRRNVVVVVVATDRGPLRICTTHLEYYSQAQREAQAQRMRELEGEFADGDATPPKTKAATYAGRPAPIGTVWCGDFNFPPEAPIHAAIQRPTASGARLLDAWRVLHPERPHEPTCGIHDRKQWPQGPHARDFFFISSRLAPYVAAMRTDTITDASDHQPVLLTLRPA